MWTLRSVAVLLISLALLALVPSGAMAEDSPGSQTDTTNSSRNNEIPSPNGDLRTEVEQLRQLVHEQEKRIAALEAERQATRPQVGATRPASPELASPTPATASATASSTSRRPTTQQWDGNAASPATASIAPSPPAAQNLQSGSTDERVRNLERRIQGLGPVSFSGDVRVRAEPFFGGPTDHSLERVRGRVRARFNATADLGSQFRTGISLASGDVNDPVSTNQNITGFYTRKPIALDQAFVEFRPKEFHALMLTGGKFRYPWFNTELTWDKDLNPEGAAESLGFKTNTPVLKQIALIGFQLPFAEIGGASTPNKRIVQQITYGGQLQTSWVLGSHVTLGAYSGIYDFHGSDAIALALARASGKNPQTPWSGLLPLNASNGVTNSIYTTTANTVITVNGTSFPTGVSSVTNAQFASKFSLFDNLAKIDINTGNSRFPLSFIGDSVRNLEACSNLGKVVPPPKNTTTQTFTQTFNAPCNSRQRRGYWAEARVGRLREKNDVQFGYTRIFIEREAVVSNFNYSEMRQGSSVTEHRFDFFYQFDRSVQLGFTALLGRPLATTEPWLTRLQFDTIYIF
jgi:hypothetical protein